jgi:hypothetical protein
MPDLSDTQIRALAARLAAEQERRIEAIVERKLRERTGVVAATYTNPTVTVDARGRVLSMVSGAAQANNGILVAYAETTSNLELSASGHVNINWSDVQYDPLGTVTLPGSAWFWTAPATGWYAFSVSAEFYNEIGNWKAKDFCRVAIGYDATEHDDIPYGVVASLRIQADQSGTIWYYDHGTVWVYRVAGATVQPNFWFTRATGGTAHAFLALRSNLAISFLSGALTGGSAGGLGDQGTKHLTGASSTLTLANGSDTRVDYNIQDTDPWSQWAGNTFTAGVDMTVDVTASLASTGETWASGDSWQLYVKKNNTSNVGTIDSHSGASGSDVTLSGTATGISLVAGDFIEVFVATTHSAGDVSVSTTGASLGIDRTA